MFDSGYLARGLVLIQSLRDVGDESDIWVLCLDHECHSYLERLGPRGVNLIAVDDLVATSSGLEDARTDRSRAEFFFTCTPSLVRRVIASSKRYDWVVYLDADMRFFKPPGDAFDEMGDGDVGIVPHRFPSKLASLEQYGKYNVAWVMFRNSPTGRDCAEWWSERCIEWCFDRPSEGRYADQGYLDAFPARFPSTVVLQNSGLNVAPWNLGRHEISSSQNGLLVDGDFQLVFFHFHGLRRRGDWIYPSLGTYHVRLTPLVRDEIYAPYIAALGAAEAGALQINAGHPIHAADAPAARNQWSLRSTAYRARRRFVQARERMSGSAFRIAPSVDDAAEDRRYG